jgi:endonuclease/exonuclease/phosphatase (EEP) superfamily protein YafD
MTRGHLRGLVAGLVLVGAFGLLAAAVLAELGDRWWAADLFAHFRFHYLAIGAVLLLAALVVRSRWLSLFVLAACAPHVWSLFAYPTAPVAAARAASRPHLRVVTFNLYYGNRSLDRVATFLRRTDADIVCLQEVTGRLWQGLRRRLGKDYPHWSADSEARGDNLILSRHPLGHIRVGDPVAEAAAAGRRAARRGVPDWALRFRYVEAVADTPRGPLRVLCVHPPYPVSAPLTAIHRLHLDAFARRVKAGPEPVIVVGDMNLSPYSPRFRAWVRRAGLRPAPRDLLWPATWPTRSHARGLLALMPGIPIDHVLLGPGVDAIRTWRGGDVGSDHFPLAADLRLAPPQR